MATINNTNSDTLSPFVFWAQSKNQITFKIDLKDVKEPSVTIHDENLLRFKAYGIGARGINNYQFVLNLYSNIKTTTCRALDSKVEVVLEKIQPLWWPRLTAQPQKPHWLKIDFDRWTTEEDLEDTEQDNIARDIMEDYPGMYEKLQKEEYGYIKEQSKKVYLIFYNFAQFIGYLYVIVVMSILCYRDGDDAISATYESVGNAMKFCQLLQYLEVMHPLFGYTKGNVLIPFLQVSGRNFVLFAMIESEPRMQSKPVIFYLFFVWSLIEVIRYPYYIVTLLKQNVAFLTWLRYTMWIPLYPLGILCEGIVLLRNIPYFEETQRFSVFLPNKWNFIFSMTAFMKIYLMLLILPGTYLVMTHMAKIRAKKLKPPMSKSRNYDHKDK